LKLVSVAVAVITVVVVAVVAAAAVAELLTVPHVHFVACLLCICVRLLCMRMLYNVYYDKTQGDEVQRSGKAYLPQQREISHELLIFRSASNSVKKRTSYPLAKSQLNRVVFIIKYV